MVKKTFAMILVLAILLSLCACGSMDKGIYEKAAAAFDAGEYAEAAVLFRSVSEYEDSAARAKECDYFIACAELDNDNFEKAIELFKALGDYRDCVRKIAEAEENIFGKSVVGSWVCEGVDMVGAVQDGIRSSMGESGEELLSYLPMMEFVVNIRLELLKDGKYTVSLDTDSFASAKAGLVTDLRKGLGDYVMALFKTMLDARGMALEEYEKAYGKKIDADELIVLFYDITMDELMDEIASELDTISIDGFSFSGEYRTESGRIKLLCEDNVASADCSADGQQLVFPDEGDNSAMFYGCAPLSFGRA